MSVYTQNSLVSSRLMSLIYSEDSKFNIQRAIEKYLIVQQNKWVLNQVSNSTNLNYNLFSSKLIKFLFESQSDIELLYKNYTSSYHKNESLVSILSKVGIDYV